MWERWLWQRRPRVNVTELKKELEEEAGEGFLEEVSFLFF